MLWLLAAGGVAAPVSSERAATWVWLDKGVDASSQALAERARELSPRALARRRRVRGDAGVDARDLAIAPDRLAAITATGARVRVVSRWLGAVSVDADAPTQARLEALPWVRALSPVAAGRRDAPTAVHGRAPLDTPDPTYGVAFDQLQVLGVPDLHACGLTGAGVVVGVLDTGFVLDHEVFADLEVIAAHDFVHDDDIVADEVDDVPGQQDHGSWVLSLLAGRAAGRYSGAAPDIAVLLAKTEDLGQEQPIEEDYYVAGLEWLESMGADMSTASLAYVAWYTPDQLDGHTAITSQAAGVALDNGLIMFNSIGNDGPEPSTLRAPADTDRLIAVGAVDFDGVVGDFSSRGPTADGRIKPDVCGPGIDVWMADIDTPDQYFEWYGTSFATPLVAGVGALLLQAYPDLTPQGMADLLRDSATRAATPDDAYGWGLVQGLAAAGAYCSCVDDDGDGAPAMACGGDDCDDADPAVHPGAIEICDDARDGDCDGLDDLDDPECVGLEGSSSDGGSDGGADATGSADSTGGAPMGTDGGITDGSTGTTLGADSEGSGCTCSAGGDAGARANAPWLLLAWRRRRRAAWARTSITSSRARTPATRRASGAPRGSAWAR